MWSMSGIDNRILLSVNRVRTTFADDLGNKEVGTGTGFWVSHSVDDQEALAKSFVTNKHNLDGEMLWPTKGFQLVKSEIEVRRFTKRKSEDEDDGEDVGRALQETKFFEVPVTCWKLHPCSDKPPLYGVATDGGGERVKT